MSRPMTDESDKPVKITCNLERELWQRLDNLAKKTGRVKSFYVRQAIIRHLAELEEQGENHLAVDFEKSQ
ncbi:TraY domain-containing protein [Moraxella lacunata]|nr:TraY domain-containing protein [Moraxella lacunata]